MANKLERFMLSFAALTPLLMTSLPAIAQTSSKMPHNPMQKSMTTPQVRNVTSSPPSAQMPSKSNSSRLSRYSPASAPILKIGSQGKAVKDVQAFLKQQKLYTGAIDGVFGQQMRSAVTAFQQSQHLSKDGLIGQETWAAMLKSQLG